MSYARVALDIPARVLAQGYDYLIPEELEQTVQVGSTVTVQLPYLCSARYSSSCS